MYSIFFTICAFFFNVVLMIAYFSRKRIKKVENLFYSGLIISSFIGLLVEILSAYLVVIVRISPQTLLYQIVVKSIYALFLFWISCLTTYFVALLGRNKKLHPNTLPIILSILCFINIIVVSLPMNAAVGDEVLLPLGPCILASEILGIIYIIIIMIVAIYNRKNLQLKEYIPIILTLIMFIVNIYIQIKFEIYITNAIFTFITFVMYFTIENPDMKMLEQVEMAKEQADKANKAKSDFLSSMSHEIRTPLNAIVGFSEGLKEENLSSKAKEDVDDIISASNTLLETVNGILDISKIEANKIEIINSDYDFYKIYNEIIALSKARLGDDKPIEFKYTIAEDVPKYLYGDYARVKQVILNLLTNAIKYTNEGYISLDVKCINNQGISRLIIKVEDSGIGIKKEDINKLFNKFERLENEGSTIEGTGLGLAITKNIVDLMNGKIVVQSIYGQGSQFLVTLDQKISDGKNIKEKEEVEESINNNLSNKKVLIVDDNKLNLKVAIRLLESYGFKIESANSGFECLDLIKQGKYYDLILLDDMMPGKSGKETYKELKSNPNFHIPVVMLTANAIEGMKEEYLKEGFSDYLAKPIEKNELNRIIKEYLDK